MRLTYINNTLAALVLTLILNSGLSSFLISNTEILLE